MPSADEIREWDVDAAAHDRIRARAIEMIRAFEKDGRVRVPGMARCVVGTK